MPTKKKYQSILNNPKRYKHYLEEKKMWMRKYRFRHSFITLSYQTMRKRGNKIPPFEFWKLAKKQKLICPLTGRKLTSETISIDHIVPVCKGGSIELSNIQLVHVDANYAKQDLFQEDFIQLCNEISKKHPR